MCSIIGWSGKLPKGLITRLLIKAESRGRDSVGLAFRVNNSNKAYRVACSASGFIADKSNGSILSDARRSTRGIAHARRASTGMPIDERNAHPFPYWRYFFAHNGKIQNWREIREMLIGYFSSEAKRLREAGKDDQAQTAEYCVGYSQRITTDSMVLGPYIEARNFSSIIGCMGLVWLRENNVYVLRYAKEAVAATVIWHNVKPSEDENTEDHLVTLIASTEQIISGAFEKMTDIEYDISYREFPEGHIFRVEPTGLVDEGEVQMNKPVEDAFTSEIVETAAEQEAELQRELKDEQQTQVQA